MHDAAPYAFSDELRLEPSRPDAFRAQLHGFGGLTLGIAGHALARTCPGRHMTAFHGTFLRAAEGEGPADVSVVRLREGRLLAHRRVEIRRGDRVLFEANGTFATPADGIGFQQVAPDLDVPAPEALPDEREVAEREGMEYWGGPVAFRWIGSPWPVAGPGEGTRWSVWVRPHQPLNGDAALQAGALAFLCDIHCDYAVRRRLGPEFTRDRFVSLEQSLWVHDPAPWDDWWLMTSDTDTAAAGRALNWRWLHDRTGRHLATMAQHSLLRDAPE